MIPIEVFDPPPPTPPLIRAAVEEDLPFIINAWVKSFADSETAMVSTPRDGRYARRCERCNRWVPKQGELSGEYRHGQRRLIMTLLETSKTLIAEATDVKTAMIDGFATYSRGPAPVGQHMGFGWEPSWVVHYVYVRKSARKRGVARALLAEVLEDPAVRVVYTHRSTGVDGSRLPRNVIFDPYEIYRHIEMRRSNP